MLITSLFKHWSYRIFAPGTLLREKYDAFKQLLQYDISCHQQMAELQDLHHLGHRQDLTHLRKLTSDLSKNVAGMIDSLEMISPGSSASLKSYHRKFDFYIRFLLAPPKPEYDPPLVLPFAEIFPDTQRLGNKAKNLAILRNKLGTNIPTGFGITTGGFHYFIEYNQLRSPIDQLLAELDVTSQNSLTKTSAKLKNLILSAPIPPKLENSIDAALAKLQLHPANAKLAVRSSGIFEDSSITFAGQYETLLHVQPDSLCFGYREVLASKYSAEPLYYRISHGLGDEETAMSVLVQEMVDARCSGVLYSSETTSKTMQNNQLQIYCTQGTGDKLVSGKIIPEIITMSRVEPYEVISQPSENVLISDGEMQTLAENAIKIENYFGGPQDIEWAIDRRGEVFILQARQLQLQLPDTPPQTKRLDPGSTNNKEIVLDNCIAASPGVAAGNAFILSSSQDLDEIPNKAVLVILDALPMYVMLLDRISAVVSEYGSRASHFATVAREFGIPFVAGASEALTLLKNGNEITVDGSAGLVYKGHLESVPDRVTTPSYQGRYKKIVTEAMKFITPLELIDPKASNFVPEGCRSMHDIIRFCHEKALLSMFITGRPGSGRGAVKLQGDIPLDVFLFDVGGAIEDNRNTSRPVQIEEVRSDPFQALWRGLAHPDIQWKQKPFDWEAYDKVILSGGVPPKQESFSFSSYGVVSRDYLHFNIRFGYHFAIIDVLCGINPAQNHCMLRFAGGGGDYENRSLRISFLSGVLKKLQFQVDQKGDLLEAILPAMARTDLEMKLDMLGRLLGSSKLMDMILEDDKMVSRCIDEFFEGRYSFSEQG